MGTFFIIITECVQLLFYNFFHLFSIASCNICIVSFISEGVDYISINEIVNFQSGETLKNISITILDDSYIEETEYFILKIESMEGDVTLSISEAVATIQDNDGNY